MKWEWVFITLMTIGEAISPSADRLDPVRDLLVELKFEQALAQIDLALDDETLNDEERFDAHELRSQTFAALGEFDRAESDYRQLLQWRPDWTPDRTATPKKAMQRFDELRDKVVGTVRFLPDPPDALVVVDDVVLESIVDPIALWAGSHTVRVERRGHDTIEETVEVQAGDEQEFAYPLVPNARTVIFRTEPEGVEVWVDGELSGVTVRDPAFVGLGPAPAEWQIEDLPLGEHRFELKKSCYRTEAIVDALNVDLLDRQPKRYPAVTMVESYVRVEPQSSLTSATIQLDDQQPIALDGEALLLCPGEHRLTVRQGGRTLWVDARDYVAGPPVPLPIVARPNVGWIGVEPSAIAALASASNNWPLELQLPAANRGQLDAWRALDLPADLDLVVAPAAERRAGFEGVADAYWIYSPALAAVERVERWQPAAPSWTRFEAGWSLLQVGSDVVVLAVESDSAAATLGLVADSRLLSVGGRTVTTAQDVADQLIGDSVAIRWETPTGEAREGTLQPREVRDWQQREPATQDAFWRAATAVVLAASDDPQSADALANLALLLERYDDPRTAADQWRRAATIEPALADDAMFQYLRGRALQRAGQETAAIASFRKAYALAAAGDPVGAAARDRLADFGATP